VERSYLDCELAVNEKNCPIYGRPEFEEPFRKEMTGLPTVKEGGKYPQLFRMDSETREKILAVCRPCDNYRSHR
jgi:hypothetical protein